MTVIVSMAAPQGIFGGVSEQCSWCGAPVDDEGGFRATEPEGDRRAVFCRLEHVVPWIINGAHWEPGRIVEPGDDGLALGVCAQCGGDLGDTRVLLVRHRGAHRIADAFCRLDHLLEWAKRGGRWRSGV
jgi:hypothetical protein